LRARHGDDELASGGRALAGGGVGADLGGQGEAESLALGDNAHAGGLHVDGDEAGVEASAADALPRDLQALVDFSLTKDARLARVKARFASAPFSCTLKCGKPLVTLTDFPIQ
jgi:hypothetical protein